MSIGALSDEEWTLLDGAAKSVEDRGGWLEIRPAVNGVRIQAFKGR